MRILIVNNYARVTGGADLHCLQLTRGLRDRGHEVAWLSTADPGSLERRGAFVKLRVSSATREGLPPRQRLEVARRALWNADAAAAMRRLAQDFAPDVVHVHKAYVQLSVAPVATAHRLGLPIVQTVHDYEFVSANPLDDGGSAWDATESRAAYRLLNSATGLERRRVHRRMVDRWIAVSASVAEVHSRVGIESTVIPNFCLPDDVEPPPRDERSGVLFAGRLSREKGIADVLAAAQRLPSVRFTVAGDGPLRAEVEAMAKRSPNLTFLGQVTGARVRELNRSARLTVMPSRWREPGPLACLEAMGEGTPVVAFDNGGLAEYVRGTGGGTVCPADAGALVEAIERGLSDGAAWDGMSEAARRGVRRRHTLPIYLDALEAVYRGAIDS